MYAGLSGMIGRAGIWSFEEKPRSSHWEDTDVFGLEQLIRAEEEPQIYF